MVGTSGTGFLGFGAPTFFNFGNWSMIRGGCLAVPVAIGDLWRGIAPVADTGGR